MDINISYKRDMNHSYILFSGGTIETENYQVQMVLHRLLPGLLPCCLYSLDNQNVWCCENTSKQKLSVYCQMHSLGKEELIWIYGSLLKNLQEIQEYLINPNTVYLTPEELYVDPFKNQVQCCMVPFYEKDIWESLLELSQYLLGFLNQQDNDAVALAYGIFRYLSQGGSSLETLWTMLYGGQEEEDGRKREAFEENENWYQSNMAERQNGNLHGMDAGKRQNRKADGLNALERQSRNPHGSDSGKRQSRNWHGSDAGKRQSRNWYGSNAVEGQSRSSDRLNAMERQNRNPDELSAVEKRRIAEIDLEMEQQRQRDLDAIFRRKEDFTKKKWQWPAWLRRWKREKQEKQEESMEEILFGNNDSVDFDCEIESILENKGKKTSEGDVVEENAYTREEKRSVQMGCDEGWEQCEEKEEATTLLSAVRGEAQAVLIHDFSKERFVLEQPIVVIGKMPGAAQLILKEATVSRIHARMIRREDGYYLEDMNSKNGTYVNEELLESQKQVKLKAGDKISFADVAYTYLE